MLMFESTGSSYSRCTDVGVTSPEEWLTLETQWVAALLQCQHSITGDAEFMWSDMKRQLLTVWVLNIACCP